MDLLGGFLIGSVDQAESGSPILVKPIGEELDPIVILKRQVLQVRLSDFRGACSLHVMAVKEDGHERPPQSCDRHRTGPERLG